MKRSNVLNSAMKRKKEVEEQNNLLHDNKFFDDNQSNRSFNEQRRMTVAKQSVFNVDDYKEMANNPFQDEDIQDNDESSIFAVNSDVYFLYMIGKMCAESGHNLTQGLQALNDYYLLMWHYSGSHSQTTTLEK